MNVDYDSGELVIYEEGTSVDDVTHLTEGIRAELNEDSQVVGLIVEDVVKLNPHVIKLLSRILETT